MADELQRLMQHVEVVDGACWEWTGAAPNRYGKTRFGGRQTTAHRAVWLAMGGTIPEGFHLDHLCFNTTCVNPAHLEPVTPQENLYRMWDERGRATACPHCGRLYSISNGRKRCKTCERVDTNARGRRRRAAGRTPTSHGLNGYTNYGCRCEACTAAMREYRREWKERQVV